MSQAGSLGINASNLPPSVPTSFICDVGVAVPIANVLDVFGGSGVQTTGVGNTITINVSTTGFTWQVVTSAMNPITLTKANGYICKGAGVVQFVLPAAANVGDTFFIKGYGNLWTLAQNALQTISLGASTTTAGVSGSIAATQIKDTIEILCVTANLEFETLDSIGNLIIV
jgi:hypothetical protein